MIIDCCYEILSLSSTRNEIAINYIYLSFPFILRDECNVLLVNYMICREYDYYNHNVLNYNKVGD